MFVTVKIKKGFAAGKTARAQVVREDGRTFFVCCPGGCGVIWYPADYIEIMEG